MKLLVAIEISDKCLKKIGWALGNYSDEPLEEEEIKDWIDATLQDTIDDLPSPPE